MARKTKDRERIETRLLKKGDLISFSISKYTSITRMIADLNNKARAKRQIKPNDLLYSSAKNSDGKSFNVIRNI